MFDHPHSAWNFWVGDYLSSGKHNIFAFGCLMCRSRTIYFLASSHYFCWIRIHITAAIFYWGSMDLYNETTKKRDASDMMANCVNREHWTNLLCSSYLSPQFNIWGAKEH